MRKVMLLAAATAMTTVGCRSRDHYYQDPADRVNVQFPGGNVRVGAEGATQVNAPFTHVQTPAYHQNTAAQMTQAQDAGQAAAPEYSAPQTPALAPTYAQGGGAAGQVPDAAGSSPYLTPAAPPQMGNTGSSFSPR